MLREIQINYYPVKFDDSKTKGCCDYCGYPIGFMEWGWHMPTETECVKCPIYQWQINNIPLPPCNQEKIRQEYLAWQKKNGE